MNGVRHLRAVDNNEPTVQDLKQQINVLTGRLNLSKSLLSHRDWTGCEKNARLVRMALEGASIADLQAEERKDHQA